LHYPRQAAVVRIYLTRKDRKDEGWYRFRVESADPITNGKIDSGVSRLFFFGRKPRPAAGSPDALAKKAKAQMKKAKAEDVMSHAAGGSRQGFSPSDGVPHPLDGFGGHGGAGGVIDSHCDSSASAGASSSVWASALRDARASAASADVRGRSKTEGSSLSTTSSGRPSSSPYASSSSSSSSSLHFTSAAASSIRKSKGAMLAQLDAHSISLDWTGGVDPGSHLDPQRSRKRNGAADDLSHGSFDFNNPADFFAGAQQGQQQQQQQRGQQGQGQGQGQKPHQGRAFKRHGSSGTYESHAPPESPMDEVAPSIQWLAPGELLPISPYVRDGTPEIVGRKSFSTSDTVPTETKHGNIFAAVASVDPFVNEVREQQLLARFGVFPDEDPLWEMMGMGMDPSPVGAAVAGGGAGMWHDGMASGSSTDGTSTAHNTYAGPRPTSVRVSPITSPTSATASMSSAGNNTANNNRSQHLSSSQYDTAARYGDMLGRMFAADVPLPSVDSETGPNVLL
jgi:hypothetical protein